MARQIQHRPEREGAKGRELSEAKKEIKQLKRQVSRLQKLLQKAEEIRGVPIEEEEEDFKVRSEAIKPIEEQCGKCGAASWVSFTTPSGKTFKACKVCKGKK